MVFWSPEPIWWYHTRYSRTRWQKKHTMGLVLHPLYKWYKDAFSGDTVQKKSLIFLALGVLGRACGVLILRAAPPVVTLSQVIYQHIPQCFYDTWYFGTLEHKSSHTPSTWFGVSSDISTHTPLLPWHLAEYSWGSAHISSHTPPTWLLCLKWYMYQHIPQCAPIILWHLLENTSGCSTIFLL